MSARAIRLLPALVVFLFVGALLAGSDNTKPPQGAAPPKDYFGNRTLTPLPGKAIGILMKDGKDLLQQEGRKGLPNAMLFSFGESSYRWFYVPVKRRPLIGAMLVSVGEKGTTKKRFDRLSPGTAETVKPWGITAAYTLVEMQVNGGQGGPADENFVATNMKIVENTKDYPLQVGKVVEGMQVYYRAWLKSSQDELETLFTITQDRALHGRKPNGTRQTRDLVHVTWLAESKQLKVRFQTETSNSLTKRVTEPTPYQPPADLKTKPPAREGLRGTVYGVESGLTILVNRLGQMETTIPLPPHSFQRELTGTPAYSKGIETAATVRAASR